MARPITDKQRRDALILAATKWVNAHGGNQTRAAAAAVKRGTPIKQQSLGWAMKGQKLGPKLASELSAIYDTTPDGLVRYLLGEGCGEVPLRDIPGWARAKAAAMETSAHLADSATWAAIDHVTIPFAIGEATADLVIAFAQLLFRFSRTSGVRIRVATSE